MFLDKAIDYSVKTVDEGLKTLSHAYPGAASVDNIYPAGPNNEWTNGFWTGMLWLAYEFTGNKRYMEEALWQVDDFLDRIVKKIEVDHHDMGFLYSPSCVAAYKILRNETAKKRHYWRQTICAEDFRRKDISFRHGASWGLRKAIVL